jgi:hypothetical protein
MVIDNLEDIQKGNTLDVINVNLYNEDNTGYDLTGASVFVQFRHGSKSGLLVGDFFIGTGLTWIDQANGHFVIDQIDELDWDLGTYYYDVRVKESGFPMYTPIGGTMKVVEIVTKRSS